MTFPTQIHGDGCWPNRCGLIPRHGAWGAKPSKTILWRRYIKKNTMVVCSQWVMHRDPRYYSRARNAFDPERWTPEAKAARPKFSYFPFSAGPRQCIGESFAWMEGVLLLATLAQKWRAG